MHPASSPTTWNALEPHLLLPASVSPHNSRDPRAHTKSRDSSTHQLRMPTCILNEAQLQMPQSPQTSHLSSADFLERERLRNLAVRCKSHLSSTYTAANVTDTLSSCTLTMHKLQGTEESLHLLPSESNLSHICQTPQTFSLQPYQHTPNIS